MRRQAPDFAVATFAKQQLPVFKWLGNWKLSGNG